MKKNKFNTIDDIEVPELEIAVKKFKPLLWTEYDEKLMKKYYGKVPNKMLAKYMKRSLDSVYGKARRMNLTSERF